jgi:predicted nucleic acid-binding Zn ribbon protein
MTGFLCILGPTKDQCFFCGEWVHVEGGDILHNDQWFCSDECVEVIEAQRADAEHRRIHGSPDWCQSCGFDRYEHADDCTQRGSNPSVAGDTNGRSQGDA